MNWATDGGEKEKEAPMMKPCIKGKERETILRKVAEEIPKMSEADGGEKEKASTEAKKNVAYMDDVLHYLAV